MWEFLKKHKEKILLASIAFSMLSMPLAFFTLGLSIPIVGGIILGSALLTCLGVVTYKMLGGSMDIYASPEYDFQHPSDSVSQHREASAYDPTTASIPHSNSETQNNSPPTYEQVLTLLNASNVHDDPPPAYSVTQPQPADSTSVSPLPLVPSVTPVSTGFSQSTPLFTNFNKIFHSCINLNSSLNFSFFKRIFNMYSTTQPTQSNRVSGNRNNRNILDRNPPHRSLR